jgi:ethanolamine utilization protein EutA
LEEATRDFALAFRWRGAPEYQRLRALADAIALGLSDKISAGGPLYLMLEGDAALTLGHILRDEKQIASPLLVIDGISLRDFDFVDIGRIRLPSNMVPVTIKSLLFDVAQR